jgi:putative hydrolase of the HAD superfamily
MIRAIAFDVDGVAVRPWGWRDRLTQHYGITAAMTAPFFTGAFGECALGRADLIDVLPPFLELWGWPHSTSDFIAQWCAAENAPDQDVLRVVADLRQHGIPCYVASTQERHRAEYLRTTMGFSQHFDGLFFSSDIGCEKPHREFFDTISAQLRLPAHELLFFDDLQKHVDGARACGWSAELFTSVECLRQHLTSHGVGC